MPVKQETVTIKPANIVRANVLIKGTTPLVQAKFSEKAKRKLIEDAQRSKAHRKSKSEQEPRDFDQEYKDAQHISTEGWNGHPCSAFRKAMIDACRTTGLVMTRAKMSVFVVSEGLDRDEGIPLVRILGPGPEKHLGMVRADKGSATVASRPMFKEWGAKLCLEYDADMVSGEEVINLLDRAGRQVGIGEGRNFSREGTGLGWGCFSVVNEEDGNG
jgi:hypothetical protein